MKATNAMRLIHLTAAMIVLAAIAANAAPGPWEQPASALADQVAAILGPGPAHVTIQNLSSIPTSEIPAIRRLLVQDLKAHGITAAGPDSANTVRVTLSESASERLLVAEVVEGNQTQVAMVDLGPVELKPSAAADALILRIDQILTTREPLLAVLETPSGTVALEPDQIVIYGHSSEGWQEKQRASISSTRATARDPRGALLGHADGSGFEAWVPGVECSGSVVAVPQPGNWTIQCREGDDPWAITQPPLDLAGFIAGGADENVKVTPSRAFYNPARNYFTGVLAWSAGVDLPPFYDLAIIPRAAGSGALLIGGIDGKVQLAENGALHTVAGTRDWGSDFAVLHSGCGAGWQIIASGSGEAVTDSLRAYDLPALETIPASAPLAMNGAVMALWTAPDGKSVLAVVRNAGKQYEVDRVTALCN